MSTQSRRARKSVFDHISLICEAHQPVLLRPIAASVTSIPKCYTLDRLPCLYARAQAEPSAIFVHVFGTDFCRENFLIWRLTRSCGNVRSRGKQDLCSRGEHYFKFLQHIARHTPIQLQQYRPYHDLVEFLCAWYAIWSLP